MLCCLWFQGNKIIYEHFGTPLQASLSVIYAEDHLYTHLQSFSFLFDITRDLDLAVTNCGKRRHPLEIVILLDNCRQYPTLDDHAKK